ncbi:MAG: hypothetical protein KC680_03600 [Candidatus Peregrinibacteria bacterium]|nr:hypothetical protein [Candidatus Peregrinibacteria bacterium]MCB9808633.1 hypothetical protein [Candidatus Peribacteria bacterium]
MHNSQSLSEHGGVHVSIGNKLEPVSPEEGECYSRNVLKQRELSRERRERISQMRAILNRK